MIMPRNRKLSRILCSGICVYFILSIGFHLILAHDLHAEIDDEIDAVIEDEEDTQEGFFSKDWNWAPVPSIISNPTLGTGLALALMYMHPRKEGDATGRSDVTGVAGLYTSTDSWATGIFHSGSYFKDRFRPSGGLFYADFNLKFYGIGNDSPIRDNPIDYNAKITAFMPKFLFNLGVKNWFAGPAYRFMKFDNAFDLSPILPGLPEIRLPTQTAGLGLVVSHDSRDNNMWASSGNLFEIELADYGEWLGGDFDYEKVKAKFVHYMPLVDQLTLAYRLDGEAIGGDAPFYDLAYLNLRGFPRGFYSDKVSATAQVQGNWQFLPRWIALAFGGGGRVSDDISNIGSETTRWAGGMGVRYVLNEKQKLSIGVDVTYGDDEFGVYIVMGDGLSN